MYTVLSIGFNGVLSRKIFSFNQGIFGENNDTFSDEKYILVSVQRYSLLFRSAYYFQTTQMKTKLYKSHESLDDWEQITQ